MSPPIKQTSFAGGEVAPFLFGRTEFARYENSVRTMRNFIAMRHGGATQRPGTQFIAITMNGGNPVRLIPFIFNETGIGQSYVLEFGNLYIGFYQNGGVVLSGGVPLIVVSPYAQADLPNLQFAQCGDIVTIVHPSYPIYELSRITPTTWTLTQLTNFKPTQAPPTAVGIGGSVGTDNLNYLVTAVSSTGEESAISNIASSNVLKAASLASIIQVTWTPAAGAVFYRIYFSSNVGGSYGYIGQTTSVTFIDTGFTPDYTHGPPFSAVSFTSQNNYPSTVGFIQQRRAFGSTNNNPLGIWESATGDFYNFYVSHPIIDSDAIVFQIASEEVNSIQHIAELKFMLLLTSGSEIYVQGNGTGVVTPSSINASVQSQYGSSALRPLKVGDVLLFNQALGSFIRDFAFDFAIDGYRGNDITVFASHLFEGFQLTDWSYQKIPDSIVWAVRSDGQLLSCTYVREQQILAWSHHDFQNGVVQNVCCIPENGAYALYLTIQRTINGVKQLYMERLSSRIWKDEINATYLDCYSLFNGTNASATNMTLLMPTAGFKTDATAYQQKITLQASAAFFTTGMVGDQIVLSDAAYIAEIGLQTPDGGLAALGAKGNQCRCAIQSFISSTQVIITPDRLVPASLQNLPIGTWSHAVKTITGLGYLTGQQVSIWADRFLVGSPLNSTVKNVYTVPASGILTLDKWYAVIYVGLPMIADLQTLDIDTSWGETEMSKRKRTARLAIHLYKTRCFYAGSEDPDTNNQNKILNDPLYQLYDLVCGGNMLTYLDPPELITDQDYVLLEARWNKHGRIFIRNVDPLPCTILAISPQGEDAVPQAWGKRV